MYQEVIVGHPVGIHGLNWKHYNTLYRQGDQDNIAVVSFVQVNALPGRKGLSRDSKVLCGFFFSRSSHGPDMSD